jgi:hypothetical protein
MKFEDTKLPDSSLLRLAFKNAAASVALENIDCPEAEDIGLGNNSIRQMVRAGEILKETVSAASEEQIAAALLFATFGFTDTYTVKSRLSANIASKNDIFPKYLPQETIFQVCALSQEWAAVNADEIPLAKSSLALRQVITAVNTAVLEGLKNNFASLEKSLMQDQINAFGAMAHDMGDIQAPALTDKFTRLHTELGQALKVAQSRAPGAPRL